MNSAHKLIEARLAKMPVGKMVFPGEFRGLGSEDAIKMSLSRISGKGNLSRLGHGIYMKTGKTADKPSLEAIAIAIAKKEKVRIRPDGATALHKLGMTPSAPDKLTYLTDGEPRSIKLGDQRLIFKSTTRKKLLLSDTTSGWLVLALEELGKDKITEDVKKLVKIKLKDTDENFWPMDLRLAPGWIYNLLFKLYQK